MPIYRAGKGGVNIPSWTGLAAGLGEDLERAPDLSIIDTFANRRLNTIKIRGDSMEPTLSSGDVLLVETLNGGVELAPLERDEPKNALLKFKMAVPANSVFVLSINGEPPTVKRVKYDERNPLDWYMMIEADNRLRYGTTVVRKSDRVVILARVIGLVEGRRESFLFIFAGFYFWLWQWQWQWHIYCSHSKLKNCC